MKKIIMKSISIAAAALVAITAIGIVPKIGKEEAYAASDAPAISLVTDGSAPNISGGQESSLYFGNYNQSSPTDKEPVKWRVLENANKKMFLLADQNLDVRRYNESNTSTTWETSTMRKWLNGDGSYTDTYGTGGFLYNAFSAGEQSAIHTTNVVNANNPEYGTHGGNDTWDNVFLLSIGEIVNTAYGFTDSYNSTSTRVATNTQYVADGGRIGSVWMNEVGGADYWWLRSPGDIDNGAAVVGLSGFVYGYGGNVVNDSNAVRPAFNINLKSLIFTSAAVGGKSSGAVGADSLKSVGTNTDDEWKVTVKSGHEDFYAEFVTLSDDALAKIKYSGAKTGDNEYISAVIKGDDGKVKYYGNLKKCSASDDEFGTVDINIAEKLEASDTLYIFNEQLNGDKKTDYASGLIPITVMCTVTVDMNGGKIKDHDDKMVEVFTTQLPLGYSQNVPDENGMEEMLQDGSMITGPADSKYIGVEITDKNGKKTYQPGEPDYTLISNAGLKVLWESTAPPVPITRTVTFKDEDTVLSTQTVESGNKADKPDDPTKDGYTFDGWYEDADFTTAFDFDTEITADTTVYAKFTAEGDDPAPVTKHTITYDLNGGTLDGKTGTVTLQIEEGTTITLPEPTREGYIFSYWEGSAYNAGDSYTVEGDHTFTAQWEKQPEPVGGNYYPVTWDPNGGFFSDATYPFEKTGEKILQPVYKGGEIDILAEPTREGYTFLYWECDGKQYQPGQKYTVNERYRVFTAQWKKDSSSSDTEDSKKDKGKGTDNNTGSNTGSGKSKTTSTSGKSATNATNAPKTGDEGDMILWGSMVMVSLAVLVTAVIAGRRITGRKKRIRRQF